MAQGSAPLRTVERAFEVIDVLRRVDGAGPAELAERMDLPKSTAHDYLRTLEETGYVVREDGHYRVGYKLLSVGGYLRNQSRFFHSARPELRRLADETGELPNIAVEENGECVVLHAVKGEQSLDLGIYPGLRTPMHSHATGKVLLANLPADRIEALLAMERLEPVTGETITDPETLRAEFDRIREVGHAVDWDEQVVGMGTISVPIIVDNDLVGALSLSGPTGRIQNEDYRADLVQGLREAANTITVSYKYGH